MDPKPLWPPPSLKKLKNMVTPKNTKLPKINKVLSSPKIFVQFFSLKIDKKTSQSKNFVLETLKELHVALLCICIVPQCRQSLPRHPVVWTACVVVHSPTLPLCFPKITPSTNNTVSKFQDVVKFAFTHIKYMYTVWSSFS